MSKCGHFSFLGPAYRILEKQNHLKKICLICYEFCFSRILVQTIGYKAHRTQIKFAADPVTVGDLFDRLERLCGGAASWQLAQKLGGV
jgi:hypothetical protein